MSKLSWWKRTLMAVGLVVAAVAALSLRPREGRSAEPPQAAQGQTFRYAGSGACNNCHSLSKDEATKKYPNSTGFIHLDEYNTWTAEDKHSVAFKRLLEPNGRGQRMGRLLNVNVTKREAGCLGCHSASVEELKNRQGDQYNPSEGVSCENCHGPAEGWYFAHVQSDFRTKGHGEWAKVGFVNLRPADLQSEKCLSCHIGNSGEGKIVTHEMYAAGHPPLPSIEVATFTNSIPRHWWLLAERKDPNLRKALGYKEGDLEQTRLALVGAAVALRTSMQLLADEAKADEKGSAPGQEWPDYARFDCWSCHHDLKRESWRQARGYQGYPGRVPVSEWPLALVNLGIARIGLEDPVGASALRADLLRLQNELHEQAKNRPFGRKAALSKAAEELANSADVLTKKLMALPIDQGVALKLLTELVAQARKTTPDYDAARHVAWTIKILLEDIGDKLPAPKVEAIRPILADLDKGLKLDLPAGRKYEIEDQIGQALQTIGDYEPAQFQAQMEKLAEILKPE